LINISSKFDDDESFEVAAFEVINEADKALTSDDVKTKIDILISNESNDRTFLEMIVNVRKAEYDLRVIVNRDTKKNFFFEIYLETKFEKEIVRK
jgi:molybdenum cofactor biosynthesis enzyme MoaA